MLSAPGSTYLVRNHTLLLQIPSFFVKPLYLRLEPKKKNKNRGGKNIGNVGKLKNKSYL